MTASEKGCTRSLILLGLFAALIGVGVYVFVAKFVAFGYPETGRWRDGFGRRVHDTEGAATVFGSEWPGLGWTIFDLIVLGLLVFGIVKALLGLSSIKLSPEEREELKIERANSSNDGAGAFVAGTGCCLIQSLAQLGLVAVGVVVIWWLLHLGGCASDPIEVIFKK